jgi:hypothetical protein
VPAFSRIYILSGAILSLFAATLVSVQDGEGKGSFGGVHLRFELAHFAKRWIGARGGFAGRSSVQRRVQHKRSLHLHAKRITPPPRRHRPARLHNIAAHTRDHVIQMYNDADMIWNHPNALAHLGTPVRL